MDLSLTRGRCLVLNLYLNLYSLYNVLWQWFWTFWHWCTKSKFNPFAYPQMKVEPFLRTPQSKCTLKLIFDNKNDKNGLILITFKIPLQIPCVPWGVSIPQSENRCLRTLNLTKTKMSFANCWTSHSQFKGFFLVLEIESRLDSCDRSFTKCLTCPLHTLRKIRLPQKYRK